MEYWLLNKNKIADYLARNTITEIGDNARKVVWSRVIWDVTAVAWLLNDQDVFMNSRLVPVHVPEYDKHYADVKEGEFMRYVYRIKRDALMQSLFDTLLA